MPRYRFLETPQLLMPCASEPSLRKASHSRRLSLQPGSMNAHSNNLEVPSVAYLSRRRLSNVSESVARKLSNTIGWRPYSDQDIANQARTLSSQYIRARLKRAGIFSKKLGLQRLRSMFNIPAGEGIADVFQEILIIGKELEQMHPRLYDSVSRQVCVTLSSDKVIRNVISTVAHELFKGEITWCKIVSLYAIAGGLAVDCVRQGHSEYLVALVDSVGAVVESEVASWIGSQGGWQGLLSYYTFHELESPPISNPMAIVIAVVLIAMVLMVLLKSVGRMTFAGDTFRSFS